MPLGMAVQPEPMGAEWIRGTDRECPDCGRPIEANKVTEPLYAICRSCYDAYVDNAGR
jgi:hypothetical protein